MTNNEFTIDDYPTYLRLFRTTHKYRFLTCDVADELIEICHKHIVTLASLCGTKETACVG